MGDNEHPGNERLFEALDTIVQAVLGKELQSLHRAVTELDSELTPRITAVKHETATAVEQLKAELFSRLDAAKSETASVADTLKQEVLSRVAAVEQGTGGAVDQLRAEVASQMEAMQTQRASFEEEKKQAFADVATKAGQAADEIRGELHALQQRLDGRIGSIQGVVERELASKTEQIKKELDDLAEKLAGTHLELQQQIAASGRVSALLDSLASVLSTPDSLPAAAKLQPQPPAAGLGASPAPPPVAQPSPDQQAQAKKDAGDAKGRGELDNLLDRVFPQES